MSISVLDWEWDTIWSFGNCIPYSIFDIIMAHEQHKITIVHYDNGDMLSVYSINDVYIICHSMNIQKAIMKIIDIVETLTAINVHENRDKLTLAFSNNNLIHAHQELVSHELISEHEIVGIIRGHSTATVRIPTNITIHTRENMKCEQRQDCLLVSCKLEYYEQIKYTRNTVELPVSVRVEETDDSICISAKSKCELISNISICTPHITKVLAKRLSPDNLNHKCTFDDAGMHWTILSLPPNHLYSITIQPQNAVMQLKGTIRFMHDSVSQDMYYVDNRPITVRGQYKYPW